MGYDKNMTHARADASADIMVTLDDKITLRFNIQNNKDDLTLQNIDNGVKYILAKDRKDKLLQLPEPEKSDKQ
jgi:hypothetical protein